MSNVFSLAELKSKAANKVKYVEVDAYGGKIRLGSVSAKDMLEWVEGNQDQARKKVAGVRLLVRSVVDADGNRIPPEQHAEFEAAFLEKDNHENGVVIQAVLKLNGFDTAAVETAKNESGAAPAAPSPSDSADSTGA